MTMNKFMADVDDLIFDGQEQSPPSRSASLRRNLFPLQ